MTTKLLLTTLLATREKKFKKMLADSWMNTSILLVEALFLLSLADCASASPRRPHAAVSRRGPVKPEGQPSWIRGEVIQKGSAVKEQTCAK